MNRHVRRPADPFKKKGRQIDPNEQKTNKPRVFLDRTVGVALKSVALHRAGVLVSSVRRASVRLPGAGVVGGGGGERQVVGASPVPSRRPRRAKKEGKRLRESDPSDPSTAFPSRPCNATQRGGGAGQEGSPQKQQRQRQRAGSRDERASEREKRGESSDPASPNLNGLRHPGGARPRHRPRPRPPPPRRARPPHRHGARRCRRAGAPSLAPLRRRAPRRRRPHRRARPRPRLLDLQARHRRVQAPCAEQETLDRQPQARSGCLGVRPFFLAISLLFPIYHWL